MQVAVNIDVKAILFAPKILSLFDYSKIILFYNSKNAQTIQNRLNIYKLVIRSEFRINDWSFKWPAAVSHNKTGSLPAPNPLPLKTNFCCDFRGDFLLMMCVNRRTNNECSHEGTNTQNIHNSSTRSHPSEEGSRARNRSKNCKV
jgi:hypothetical protein